MKFSFILINAKIEFLVGKKKKKKKKKKNRNGKNILFC